MNCGSLTYGFDYECNEGTGGIKLGSVLIAQWDNITASTVTAGVVTSLTQAGATNFYRYQVRKKRAGDTTEFVNDHSTGTAVATSTFILELFKVSASKNVQLQLLMSKPLVIIYQDNNDVYHILGLNNGAEVTNVTRSIGKELTDMNGYTITVQHEDKDFPYEVQASVVTGLTISGDLS